jgi:hypothetical protein
LPATEFARVNAARERCDAIVAQPQREYDSYRVLAKAADGDWDSRELCEKFKSARAKAAVEFLDAQAQAYLPLAGERFPYQTLEVLAGTAVDLYGGEDAVADRVFEWRARWWDQEAAACDAARSEAPLAERTAATPQPARDSFATKEMREAAIASAKEKGSVKAVAQKLNVAYTDLRKWARQRKLAKGQSSKQDRIENGLKSYL